MEDFLVQREIKDEVFNHSTFPEGGILNLAFFNAYWVIEILDTDKKLIYLKCIPFREELPTGIKARTFIPSSLKADNLLKVQVQTKNLICSSSKVTLIPASLFSEDLINDYFRLNFGQVKDEHLAYNYISQLDAYLLFAISQNLIHQFKFLLNYHALYHIATPWLKSLFAQFQQSNEPLLFADFEDPLVRVALMREGNLVFFNTFSFTDDNDMLYYLIFISEQLGINPQKHRFYFSGTIFRHSERFKLLYRYIRYPRFLKRLANLEYSRHIEEVPEHYFYNLLGMPLCEL